VSEEIEDADEDMPAPSTRSSKEKPDSIVRSALKPASKTSVAASRIAPSSQRVVRVDSKPKYFDNDQPTLSQIKTASQPFEPQHARVCPWKSGHQSSQDPRLLPSRR
jgi:hypothetical protein